MTLFQPHLLILGYNVHSETLHLLFPPPRMLFPRLINVLLSHLLQVFGYMSCEVKLPLGSIVGCTPEPCLFPFPALFSPLRLIYRYIHSSIHVYILSLTTKNECSMKTGIFVLQQSLIHNKAIH